jgi:hypothetical protein
MEFILAVYAFIGWLLVSETCRAMEIENPEKMERNYRNPLWWIGPILCFIGWPVVFIWAWIEDGKEDEPEW